jgi:hypothetical protein
MTGSRIVVTVLVSAMWASAACVFAADARAPQRASAAEPKTPSAELLEFLGGIDTLPASPPGERTGAARPDPPPPPAPEPKP